MSFNKIYLKDDRVFTPIYLPGESYAFFVNTKYALTDPNFDTFELRLLDVDGNIIHTFVAGTLLKVGYFTSTPGPSDPYQIYAKFVFPYIPVGQYFFQIFDTLTAGERVRTNYIICETENIDKSLRIKYRNTTNRDGFNYEWLAKYYNIFRVTITQVDYQPNSDKTEYRNISDGKKRTLHTYLDNSYKIQAYHFDENALKALAVALEHDTLIIQGKKVNIKNQMEIRTALQGSLSNGDIELFTEEVTNPNSLELFTDLIILTGDFHNNPELIYDQNF